MASEQTGASVFGPKVLDWMRKHPETEWWCAQGPNLQTCRALQAKGLLEIRGYAGKWECRLTDEGRAV